MSLLILSFADCGRNDQGLAKNSGTSAINETALLFAGKDIPKGSKLSPYATTAFYKSYQQHMESGWNRLQKPNLQKISEWWQKHKPARYSDSVLYPFSGPDIMNALTFFPEADNYILFGLESPGILPDPHAMTPEQITRGLNGLKNSLGDILHMNFFKTEGMAAEMSSKSFNSIGGIIMYFLATNGYTIVSARKIAIDEHSDVVSGKPSDEQIKWQTPPHSRIPGVEIIFRKGSGKTQTVRYYMLNVIDEALKKHSPNFIPYLAKGAPYATIIKSASYLMHNDAVKFTRIRATVLATTSYLVQDDSGIPLRYFKKGSWKLGFHGYYDRPISLFSSRYQDDFKKEMGSKSTGRLPFSYGYDYLAGQSNLMTAEKLK